MAHPSLVARFEARNSLTEAFGDITLSKLAPPTVSDTFSVFSPNQQVVGAECSF
jgi:hypothetical protein